MSATESHFHPDAKQFSLRSLLCTIVSISMVLAFVRQFGPAGLQLAAIGCCGAVLLGGAIGWLAGRFVQTITWSLVGGTLALCCVLMADRLTIAQELYWLGVGISGGLFAGVIQPGKWKQRIASTALQWLCFILLSSLLNESLIIVMLDTAVTLPVLAGLAILAEEFARLQAKYRTALDLWAAGLIFAVIAGNFGAILVWNWWYV
jgi:hypothetical protein